MMVRLSVVFNIRLNVGHSLSPFNTLASLVCPFISIVMMYTDRKACFSQKCNYFSYHYCSKDWGWYCDELKFVEYFDRIRLFSIKEMVVGLRLMQEMMRWQAGCSVHKEACIGMTVYQYIHQPTAFSSHTHAIVPFIVTIYWSFLEKSMSVFIKPFCESETEQGSKVVAVYQVAWCTHVPHVNKNNYWWFVSF